MKFTLNRSIIVTVLVCGTFAFVVNTGITGQITRSGVAATVESIPVISPSNYNDVLNGLFRAGGR